MRWLWRRDFNKKEEDFQKQRKLLLRTEKKAGVRWTGCSAKSADAESRSCLHGHESQIQAFTQRSMGKQQRILITIYTL